MPPRVHPSPPLKPPSPLHPFSPHTISISSSSSSSSSSLRFDHGAASVGRHCAARAQEPGAEGRWAAEIRVPRARARLWIGTFPCPRTAALAYDAALYCFHGHSPPGNRAFNFPFAPRLRIDERRRYALTLNHVRAIAERYAHDVGSVLFRPLLLPVPPPVVPVFAAAAAPMVAAPAAANHAAAAAIDPYYSNEATNTTDEDVIAAADRLLSMDIDEVAALIAIVQQG